MAWSFLKIVSDPTAFNGDMSLKVGVAIAKSGATIVNISATLLVLSMCRITTTLLKQTVLDRVLPLDLMSAAHRQASRAFILGAVIHTSAHVFNLIRLSKIAPVNWAHPTLLTGAGLVLVCAAIAVTAYSARIRRGNFELFYYVHYLALPSLILVVLHGSFCFLRGGGCTGGTTWMWLIAPIVLYCGEQCWAFCRSRHFCYISKVIEHPSDVLEVQMRKPGFLFIPGQFVYLRVPACSSLQAHPFTLTSAPEEDHLSVHIRVAGDWTGRLASLLQGSRIPQSISIHIDGPYGCASQEYIRYEIVICIGAGIGQTPFASILKSLWFRLASPGEQTTIRRIEFVGICRNTKSFEWFNDILVALERADSQEVLKTHLFITGKVDPAEMQLIAMHHELKLADPFTGLRHPTQFGRPDLGRLFASWREKYKGRRVGIFFCGTPALGTRLKDLCLPSSTDPPDGARFHYHEEVF